MDVEEEDGGGSHDLPLNLAKNLDSRRKRPVFLSAAIKEKKKKDQTLEVWNLKCHPKIVHS